LRIGEEKVIIDVTESAIERLKKNRSYIGKKKRDSIKQQIVIGTKSGKIISRYMTK
jgi:hypothetical protein